METVRFKLGAGPLVNFLVFLALVGASAYFGHAAYANLTEPVIVRGLQVADRPHVRGGLVVLAGLMGMAALLMAVRGLRNFRKEKAIVLDANRMVLSGWDLTGQDKVLYFADIVSVAEFSTRGIPGVELTARDGSKIAIASVLFRGPQDYARCKDILMQRVSLRA